MSEVRRRAIAPCPACKEIIWDDLAQSTCPRCKAQLPDEITRALPKLKVDAACAKCGTLIPGKALFCPACGASAKEAAAVAPRAEGPPSSSGPINYKTTPNAVNVPSRQARTDALRSGKATQVEAPGFSTQTNFSPQDSPETPVQPEAASVPVSREEPETGRNSQAIPEVTPVNPPIRVDLPAQATVPNFSFPTDAPVIPPARFSADSPAASTPEPASGRPAIHEAPRVVAEPQSRDIAPGSASASGGSVARSSSNPVRTPNSWQPPTLEPTRVEFHPAQTPIPQVHSPLHAPIRTYGPETPESKSVARRYTDAYRQARTVVGVGIFFKITGIVVGVLLALGGSVFALVMGNQVGSSSFANSSDGLRAGAMVFAIAMFTAILVGAAFYLVGVGIAALGQMTKATVDTAVHSSPFLADDQKAKVMSL